MSHMIPSGTYKISNVLYQNRYVHMSGNQLVGQDTGDTIKVEVTDKVEHLATLYDTVTKSYIGIDMMSGKVIGYTEPKVLQLSSEDGKKFEIHMESGSDVWVLKDDGTIVVEPAPVTDVRYWKFEEAK